MFRKPSEDTSETEITSDRPGKGENGGNIDDSNVQRALQKLPSAAPVLEPFQHLTIHYLSYLRKECREKAAEAINSRNSGAPLPENHPDVDDLTETLYQQVIDQMRKNGVPLPEVPNQTEAQLRNSYSKNFGAALLNAALGVVDDPGRTNTNLLPFSEKSVGESGRDMLLKAINYHPGSTDSLYAKEYEELRLLGKGGYGKVFHVKNPIDGQEYAIKQITISPSKMEKLSKEGLIETVLKENRTAAALFHPNVVRYHDSWVETLVIERSSQRDREDLEDSELSEPKGMIKNNDENSTGTDVFERSHSNGNMPDFSGSDVFERSPGHGNMPDLSRSDVFERSSANSNMPDMRKLALSKSIKVTGSRQQSAADEKKNNDDKDKDEYEYEYEDEDEDIDGTVSRDVALTRFPKGSELSPFLAKTAVTSGLTVYIKMAFHPVTLKDFLLQGDNDAESYHGTYCFHTLPAARMCLAILDGVEYLHSKNIVHRDLKPANVLLSIDKTKPSFPSGFVDISECIDCEVEDKPTREPLYVTPHICDFGLAAKLDELDMVDTKESGTLIQGKKNLPVGTKHYRPAYMPTSEPIICPKLDMYSLGVIALELIFKFETGSERARVLEDLSKGKFPEGFDDYDMADGIKHMLCRDRDQRWGAKETREWLEELLSKKVGEFF